jgi:hypothetical protein
MAKGVWPEAAGWEWMVGVSTGHRVFSSQPPICMNKLKGDVKLSLRLLWELPFVGHGLLCIQQPAIFPISERI